VCWIVKYDYMTLSQFFSDKSTGTQFYLHKWQKIMVSGLNITQSLNHLQAQPTASCNKYTVSQKSEPPKHFATAAANLHRFK